MRLHTLTLSVNEMQDAFRDYVEKYAGAQAEIVVVENGFGKSVLVVPLAPGAVVRGEEFMRQTGAS